MEKGIAFGKIRQNLTLAFALVGWILTIILTYHLLSGTFESGRTCQTDCVKTLYWTAFIITVAGLAVAFAARKTAGFWGAIIGTGLLILLLAIFVTVMFVGTFL